MPTKSYVPSIGISITKVVNEGCKVFNVWRKSEQGDSSLTYFLFTYVICFYNNGITTHNSKNIKCSLTFLPG